MTRILSSDILIADVITPLSGNLALLNLVEKYHLKPGGKTAITLSQFDEFSQAVEGATVAIAPGGSSANTLVTLKKLMGSEVEVDFLGVADHDMAGVMIRHSLQEAGIALHPNPSPAAQTATSYVMLLVDGQRTIATYPGNARDILKPEMITEALVSGADVVFLQGSLWTKMGDAYADRMLDLALRYNKQIWLALPTYSLPSGEHTDIFREAITRANMVLGNEEELARIYNTSPEIGLKRLQSALTHQVGFITCADKGVALVTKQGIERIAPPPVGAVVNTLGAGDTAFAGFMAGMLKQKPAKEAAAIAMALASEKLKINHARLPDPKAVLQKLGMNF